MIFSYPTGCEKMGRNSAFKKSKCLHLHLCLDLGLRLVPGLVVGLCLGIGPCLRVCFGLGLGVGGGGRRGIGHRVGLCLHFQSWFFAKG